MITTTTHTTDSRLILPPDLREQVHIDPADASQDGALDLAIQQMSSAFSGGSGGLERVPVLQVYEERLAGRGGLSLTLSRWPVVEVLSITCDGVAVDDDWVVMGDRRDSLYREKGWRKGRYIQGAYASSGDTELNFSVSYRAGWIPPGLVVTWSASTAVESGSWALVAERPGWMFEATTGGTTGADEPAWPTEEGGEAVDGGVTWSARIARAVPADLQLAAKLHAGHIFGDRLNTPPGVSLQGDSAGSTSYATSSALLRGHRETEFSSGVVAVLGRYQ